MFGDGGITAKNIFLVGGWEADTTAKVFVGTGFPQCTLDNVGGGGMPGGKYQVNAPGTAPGCPLTGQPILADPFAGKWCRRRLGAAAWGRP